VVVWYNLGEVMKDSFYSKSELEEIGFKKLGENVLISRMAMIYNADKIEIGNHVRIDDFCILAGKIVFGDYIHIGVNSRLQGSTLGLFIKDFAGVSYNSTIIANTDDYGGEFMTNPMVPLEYRKICPKPVVLEKHSLVATHCVVLPGVTIGEGAAVGAMSLVTRDVEPFAIVCGVPAKKLKERSRKLLELEKEFKKTLTEA
jgi:acetyltransferase-like isoleucine patch superfamily enzyme